MWKKMSLFQFLVLRQDFSKMRVYVQYPYKVIKFWSFGFKMGLNANVVATIYIIIVTAQLNLNSSCAAFIC